MLGFNKKAWQTFTHTPSTGLSRWVLTGLKEGRDKSVQKGGPKQDLSLLKEEIYSVSLLTQAIKDLLEGHFSSLWVEGEISNFRAPASGHFYFTLKDSLSQIRAVMFRFRNMSLPFIPEDGMQVVCRADLSVYPPRGDYQLIIGWMEPKGQGALQLAFEALKGRLAGEGLFDEDRKKPLPFLPNRVGLITSSTGAAVRDILKVLWRRFPNLPVELYPVHVQGDNAKFEIVEALQTANLHGQSDVLIVSRGGGSLEDLWPFNEEIVARAIAGSSIPVISAVGHEIDFTISDFVADKRAPTPSAAAEMVIPEKSRLEERVVQQQHRLNKVFESGMIQKRAQVEYLSKRLIHPGKRVAEQLLRLDELAERLQSAWSRFFLVRYRELATLSDKLSILGPQKGIRDLAEKVQSLEGDLVHLSTLCLERKRGQWQEAARRLESLSPLAVLSRGYSITRLLPSHQILKDAARVTRGDSVEVILAQGQINCVAADVFPAKEQEGD